MSEQNKRELGQYFTTENPFNNKLFEEWWELVGLSPDDKMLEPFAGSNNIVLMIKEIGISNKWECYDIEPPLINVCPEYKVIRQDTIANFPIGFKVAITNPPYLARVSASRRKIPYPDTVYDDVYKECIGKMLDNVDYVAAIIPESFITSGLFHDRLYGVISLNTKMFEDTECPVCLALFIPSFSFKIYVGDKYVGNYNDLKQYNLLEYDHGEVKWVFNDKNGSIGVKCVDNQISNDIYFHDGLKIDPDKIKVSSRSFTRIGGLPENIDLDKFILICNRILDDYRNKTKDVFLTSFKGLRKDGKYRRRIDFKTLRCILNKAYKEYES